LDQVECRATRSPPSSNAADWDSDSRDQRSAFTCELVTGYPSLRATSSSVNLPSNASSSFVHGNCRAERGLFDARPSTLDFACGTFTASVIAHRSIHRDVGTNGRDAGESNS